MEAEKCALCGRAISEGAQVCPDCLKIMGRKQQETAGELRDITDVLSITANMDGNIKRSTEALLRIASRLEREKK